MDAQTPVDAPAQSVNPRDLSYAASAKTGLGRFAVRLIENLTGRIPVLYRLLGYDKEVAAGEPIWDVVWRRYDLSFEFVNSKLENMPAKGPLVVVANHPFGILDGLALGVILHKRRPDDFMIIANAVFAKAPELADRILPIDFEETREAVKTNLETRKRAVAHLKAGGCVAVFPGGAVSASAKMFGAPFDGPWKPFAARMIRESGARVTPIFFEGRNSKMFDFASHASYALYLGLYIREFSRRIGKPVRVVVGDPVEPVEISQQNSEPRALMAYLRARVYALSPTPIAKLEMGREWD